MKTQTEIKIPYEILTKEQKAEICNGCGGKGGWIKPPLKAFFKTSCNHHDYGYWCGVTEARRKECDGNLLIHMIRDILTLSWYKVVLYYPWGLLYYIGVRMAGKEYFYWGQKKRYPEPTESQCARLYALSKLNEALEQYHG